MTTRSVVIGTAGHIDHGKTTLVRALTGVDCDRLDEEKRRGITIVLGFAALDLPDGRRVGIVDVPGHEKFVRTMVAGAGGVDVGLLVVAADEGVMPQTREHVQILAMLGVPQLVVALTRSDAVDEELLELAELDVSELLAGTPWPDAPLHAVSGLTGDGVPALKDTLLEAIDALELPGGGDVFRMPVDRSFTIKGFGTVVTGSTRDGQLDAGATLEVLPGHQPVRIRGIQSHGESQAAVAAGMRVALNLQGVEPAAVPPGSWLATPKTLACGDRLDVEFQLLDDAPWPLANNARVRLLCGTAEELATVRLLDPEGGPAPAEIQPGEHALAQLALTTELGAVAGDRFVLRAESPMRTLGGGRILDPEPPLLRRRGRAAAAKLLQVQRSDATPAQRVAAFLERTPGEALDLHALRRRLPLGVDALAAAQACDDAAPLSSDPPSWVWRGSVERWLEPSATLIDAHHRDHPLLDGPQASELRQALLPPPAPRVFDALLPTLAERLGLQIRGPRVARAAHDPAPSPSTRGTLDTVVARLAAGGAHPPKVEEALDGIALPPDGLAWLVEQGEVIRVAEDYYVAREPYRALIRTLVAHTRAAGVLTPQGFKELSGLSRRHAMPFLEFLDRQRITVRHPDGRQLRDVLPEWAG